MRARLVLGAVLIVAAATAATARSIVVQNAGDDGDQILAVSEAETAGSATVTFICTPKKKEYGIVILAPGATWPVDGQDVTVGAEGVSILQRRFDSAEGSLILLQDGEPARAMLSSALRGDVLEVTAGERRMRFTLGDGRPQVDRYRDLCGLN